MSQGRYVLFLSLCVVGAGCSRQPAEVLCDGKPASFWVTTLKDPDVHQRLRAVRALGNIGANDAPAIPALIDALKDLEPGVRAEAAVALYKNASNAHEAILALTEAKEDNDERVRQCASRALDKIQAGG